MVFEFLKKHFVSEKDSGETESRHFIRAETHMERDQAISHTIMKGRRIIDEERRMKTDRRD